ncbi:HipA domain-containing protein [Amantichitinum ursilacus]|uniref:HipA-like C-terminal domain-containing protein n=1 Tax=Amantichitinum ursilacus TaxID=857265 RepID=A0A0N1JRV5_9NEIS|nr:HipA domain-containing protein [Amantichitinum ursilacus]KPC50169.1 hypothetical protein WG78_18230 [Amantichitinum ursilacus]
MDLTLQKYFNGAWHDAARLHIRKPELGSASPCVLDYVEAYVLNGMLQADRDGMDALSIHFPVGFKIHQCTTWPAFLLDLLPSGFGRDYLVARENWPRPDGAHNDARVLACGASNPAGNSRVLEAWQWLQGQLPARREGWLLQDMQRHDADFVEYASLHGSLVGGTSTQGQAAKMWLTRVGKHYFADALVTDAEAEAAYLLKMPRNDSDAVLLQHEHLWLTLAAEAGLDLEGEPFMQGDLLFIPRFDRDYRASGVVRHAMESAYSLMNVATPGASLFHEDILTRWLDVADPHHLASGLLEYIKRDILSYCLRVEDNHGRNTAFFLTNTGLRLTPLFDFSPMFLADDPPARSTRWRNFGHGEHAQWPRLFDSFLPELIGPANAAGLADALRAWRPLLETVRRSFIDTPRDPRTDQCVRLFDIALERLDEIR